MALNFGTLGPWADELIASAGKSAARVSFSESTPVAQRILGESPGLFPELRETALAIRTFDVEREAPYPFDRSYPFNNDNRFLYRNSRTQGATASAESEQQQGVLESWNKSIEDWQASNRAAVTSILPEGMTFDSLFGDIGKRATVVVLALIIVTIGIIAMIGPERIVETTAKAVKA